MSAVVERDYKMKHVSFFSLSVAEETHKGYFSNDITTQTEQTEIANIHDMTRVMKQLVQESACLKREFTLARQAMQAEYEHKLREKAMELCERCNDKVVELEKTHEERVAVIRRSFKQQLADSLIQLSAQNSAELMSKMTQQPQPKEKKGKDKALELKLRNEELESELGEMREALGRAHVEIEELRGEVDSMANEPKISQEEVDKLQKEIDKRQERVMLLEEELSKVAGNTQQLKATVDQQVGKIKQLETDKEALGEEVRLLKKKMDEDAQKGKAVADRMRAEFQKEMAEQVEKVRKDAVEKARAEAEQLRKREIEENQRLRAELEGLEKKFQGQMAAREKESAAAVAQARRREKQLKAEIDKLGREAEYADKAWAKRIEILQQSNQAIREEAHSRSAMKRYVLKLKHAQVTFHNHDPMHYLPPPDSAWAWAGAGCPLPEITPASSAIKASKPLQQRARVTFQDDGPRPAGSVTLSYDSSDEQAVGVDGAGGGANGGGDYIELDDEGVVLLNTYQPLPLLP